MELGPRLKAARQRQGLSLRALAERTGFSASFLSQVELGQSSPSLSSLNRIVQELGLSLGAVLAEPPHNGEAIVRRRDEGLKSEWSRAVVRSLLPAGADERFAAVHVRLEPGGSSGKSAASAPGHELVYCIQGEVEVMLEDRRHVFQSGDSIYYDVQRAARWTNVGQDEAELIFVSFRLL